MKKQIPEFCIINSCKGKSCPKKVNLGDIIILYCCRPFRHKGGHRYTLRWNDEESITEITI